MTQTTVTIEVKNIKYFPTLSEETNAFSAVLYVNGQKIADVRNEGRGGENRIDLIDFRNDLHRSLLHRAEEQCKAMPPILVGLSYSLPMDLNNYIDQQIEDHILEQEKRKWEAKKQKLQINTIIAGIPDSGEYRTWKLQHPIETYKTHPNPKTQEALRTIIANVKSKLADGEVIYNTNLEGYL